MNNPQTLGELLAEILDDEEYNTANYLDEYVDGLITYAHEHNAIGDLEELQGYGIFGVVS